MLKHLIVKWNRERGLLKTFDPQLELRMLSEEAAEFYAAETFEHRLVEFADFQFVKSGTIAKNHAQKIESPTVFGMSRSHFIELMEWAEEVEANMVSQLSGEYQAMAANGTQPTYELHTVLTIALAVVIDNNEFKGKKTVGGKVVKSPDQKKPEVELKEILYVN